MTAPEPYPPLAADHPAVREGLTCPCCHQPFTVGAVTALLLLPGKADGLVSEAALVHDTCAEIVTRERLRSHYDDDPDFAFFGSDGIIDAPALEIEELREAVSTYAHEAAKWHDYARRLEAGVPSVVPAEFVFAADTRRLAWIEARLREHGPDLGYLLGLPQGWTNLRAAIDQVQGVPR